MRSLGLLRNARGRRIELKARADGRRVVLADVATVSEAFRERGHRAIRDGEAAIELTSVARSIPMR